MLVRLEDLHDALRLVYEALNDRPVVALQQSDVLGLVAPSSFGEFFSIIHKEIDHLAGHAYTPRTTPADVLAKADEMGYDLWPHQKLTVSDPFVKWPIEIRGQLIYDSLADLLAVRLREKRIGWTCIRVVPESESLETEHWATVNRKLQSLGQSIGFEEDLGHIKSVEALATSLMKMLPKMGKHWSTVKPKPTKGLPHLLIPKWSKTEEETLAWVKLVDRLNSEYIARRKVMLTRLNVTVQAFLWSDRARGHFNDFCGDLAGVMAWSESTAGRKGVTCYEVLSADRRLLAPRKISSNHIVTPLKKIQVGGVPNRGGVPEGFAVQDVTKDVQKANVALQHKDQPKRIPAANQTSGGSTTQWIGSSAAAAQPKRATTWKRTGQVSATASQAARIHGGVYTGAHGNYASNGRRRFPAGGFDPAQDCPALIKSASAGSQLDRRVYADQSLTREVDSSAQFNSPNIRGGGWGGRHQDANQFSNWNPGKLQN